MMEMIEEIWKDVVGYEGLYQVSNLGRVKSLERTFKYGDSGRRHKIRSRIMRTWINDRGYHTLHLKKDCVPFGTVVHRLVVKAFLENPNNYEEVNHKDGIRTNNVLSNLEWVNRSMNVKHSYDFLNRKRSHLGKKGKDSHSSKVVIQYDMNGNFIARHFSLADVKREYNFEACGIAKCCRGENTHAYKFKWKFESDIKPEDRTYLNEKKV